MLMIACKMYVYTIYSNPSPFPSECHLTQHPSMASHPRRQEPESISCPALYPRCCPVRTWDYGTAGTIRVGLSIEVLRCDRGGNESKGCVRVVSWKEVDDSLMRSSGRGCIRISAAVRLLTPANPA